MACKKKEIISLG